MTVMSGKPSRAVTMSISGVVLVVAAVAVVWFVNARDDTGGAIAESNPTAALDGFVRAYNDDDTAELQDRVCRDRLTSVSAAVAVNRRTLTTLRRTGPLQRSHGGGAQQVTVQLDGRGSGEVHGAPLLSVAPRAEDSRWCVSAMTGTFRALPVAPSR